MLNIKFSKFSLILLIIINTLLLSACGPLIVASAAGTVAVLADRRTTGTIIEDNSIELKAIQKVKSSEIDDTSNISVTSYNERVLITGQAQNKQTKNQITQIIKQIPKVRTIYNEVDIAPNNSITNSSYDTWLTTKVKAKLTSNPDVNPLNIKVITSNKVVYLMGLVSQPEAEAATDVARNISGVEKVVKLFEYVDSFENKYAKN